jgi:hypothetical protein
MPGVAAVARTNPASIRPAVSAANCSSSKLSLGLIEPRPQVWLNSPDFWEGFTWPSSPEFAICRRWLAPACTAQAIPTIPKGAN